MRKTSAVARVTRERSVGFRPLIVGCLCKFPHVFHQWDAISNTIKVVVKARKLLGGNWRVKQVPTALAGVNES